MKPNVKTVEKVMETMPIYGELRKKNKQLTFGQYLTILKKWFDSLRTETEGFKKELHQIYDKKETDWRIMQFIREEILGDA